MNLPQAGGCLAESACTVVTWQHCRKRLAKRTYGFVAKFSNPRTDYTADEAGSLADVFRFAQVAGVSSALS
jgi:hypothetical protein